MTISLSFAMIVSCSVYTNKYKSYPLFSQVSKEHSRDGFFAYQRALADGANPCTFTYDYKYEYTYTYTCSDVFLSELEYAKLELLRKLD